MTLIEIIVSLALLGILATALFGLFASSILFINRAGNRNQAVYKGQQALETRIAQNIAEEASDIPASLPDVTATDEPLDMEIVFIDKDTAVQTEVEAEGSVKKVIYDNGEFIVEYYTFIPD